MSAAIKLTDQAGCTRGGTPWGPGVRHEAAAGPPVLCTKTVIHFYEGEDERAALALARLMNPAHANFQAPRAWTFDPEGEVVTDGVKSGCKAGTTGEERALPAATPEQLTEIAVRCALVVYDDPGFVKWAEAWLSGEDRTAGAARAAAWTAAREEAAKTAKTEKMARAAARAMAWAAEAAAARAAWAAMAAARAAAWAAEAGKDLDVAGIAKAVLYREEPTQ